MSQTQFAAPVPVRKPLALPGVCGLISQRSGLSDPDACGFQFKALTGVQIILWATPRTTALLKSGTVETVYSDHCYSDPPHIWIKKLWAESLTIQMQIKHFVYSIYIYIYT